MKMLLISRWHLKIFRLIFFILTLSFMASGCKQKTKSNLVEKGSLPISSKNYSLNTNANWADSLLTNYIQKTDNKLVKAALKDTIPEEWLFDQEEITDSVKYLIFQIGHDVANKNGGNKRFVTDSWVYIDSLKRMLYEYDLANDSLIEWKK